MEKCRAVLSIWTERRKPGTICRELSIPWMVLSQWQKRAMEGMLQALEPRVSLEKGAALSPRLQAMLEKRRLMLLTSAASGGGVRGQERADNGRGGRAPVGRVPQDLLRVGKPGITGHNRGPGEQSPRAAEHAAR